jgi:hypothetical protein
MCVHACIHAITTARRPARLVRRLSEIARAEALRVDDAVLASVCESCNYDIRVSAVYALCAWHAHSVT